jgi:hypothetical protein
MLPADAFPVGDRFRPPVTRDDASRRCVGEGLRGRFADAPPDDHVAVVR